IRRVAADVYEEIPDAPPRRRKRKRPRTASAEVETCRKIVTGQLKKLRDRVSHLSSSERTRLLEDPGELRAWWLEVSTEMDAFCGVESSQTSETTQVGQGGGQFVHHPADDQPAEREVSAEDHATFNRLEERLNAPLIRSVELTLRPPELVPRELTDDPDGDGAGPVSLEELEAEAVRAEACGERAPWDE
ncbi:MAG: hypothetical protein LC774_17565, partial [Acidobacteria bacterium]|nr:hypothetical protein [Acidobacteriota bacterium]